MEKLKIMIADDKPRYRAMIIEMLKHTQVTIIGQAEDGRQLLTLMQKRRPDVVFLDLEMPEMDGNEAFDIICQRFPQVSVIILSYYSNVTLTKHYLQRGAKGYISKDLLDEEVIEKALSAIQRGEVFLEDDEFEGKKVFTRRQQEMLPLLFEGCTNEEIADEMNVSTRAIEKLRQKLYERTGAKRAVDFYRYAFTKGLQFIGKLQRN